MKVELILPRREPNKLVDIGFYVVPQTLSQLAAVTPRDIDVTLTDENYEDIDFGSAPDLVGISVMTSQVNRAMEISAEYKRRGITVVWGGIHPTVVDQSDNPNIDSVVLGEAENIWPAVLHDFLEGKLKPRYKDDKPVDIDAIPLPKRNTTYPKDLLVLESTLGSRGCIYTCSHCSSSLVYGRGIKMRSISRVLEDIRNIRSKYVIFFDENIFNKKSQGVELMHQMAPLGKNSFVQIDPRSALDERLAESLGQAGVKIALIGFESVNPENFGGNPKYVPPGLWPRIVENMHKYGIKIDGNFMLGLEHDGPDIFDRTNEAIRTAKIDFVGSSIVTPYPGTGLHAQLLREGRILHHDWDKYDLRNVVFIPKLLTPSELQAGFGQLSTEHRTAFLHINEIFD